MYESEGTRAQATVSLDPALARGEVTVVDLLERPFGPGAPAFRSAVERDEDGGARLFFRPFEIKTLRISRAQIGRASGREKVEVGGEGEAVQQGKDTHRVCGS